MRGERIGEVIRGWESLEGGRCGCAESGLNE